MAKQKNIPALRFPEFNGEWEREKLGEVADIIMGQSPDGDSYNTNGIGTALINGPVEFTEKYPVKTKWTSKPTKFCQDKDILFCVRGSTTGRMNIANDIYCIGRGVAAIRANKKSTSEFIEFLIIKNLTGILTLTTGSTFFNLDSKTLKEYPSSLPTLTEQKKIASFLSAVDEKLQALKKKKSLLEQYKKGVMQKIFSQQLRFKDDKGKAFSKWEKKKLGDVLDYEQPTKYLVSSTEYNDSFETPVLTAGKTFVLGYTDEANGIFKNNLPVIIFDDFTTATKFVNFPFKAKSSAMKILLPKNGVDIKFIYETMQILNYEIGGHERHWISKFSQIEILLPCHAEQSKIANFLSTIDEKINYCQTQQEKTEQYKKGLLQNMFC